MFLVWGLLKISCHQIHQSDTSLALPNQCYLAGPMLPQMQLSVDEEGYQANVVSCQNHIKSLRIYQHLKTSRRPAPKIEKQPNFILILNVLVITGLLGCNVFFWRGTVYENLKQNDNAITDYKKALSIDSNYYDAAFNLGAFYFNSGADKINESNDLPLNESKKFAALKAEAKVYFEKAVPYVEKAHELKPADGAIGQMLIKLYTHTGNYAKSKEIKAKFQ